MSTTIWNTILNPKALILIALILVFMFGGGNFIFRNPIIIVFGLFAFIIMAMRGKK